MSKPLKVLLIENNSRDVQLIKKFLSEAKKIQFDLINIENLADAKKYLSKEKVDTILLNLGLPDSASISTFRALNEYIFDTPIIIVSGLEDEELAVTAVREGAQDYLIKSNINGDLLVHAIVYAIERKRTEKSLEELAAIVENTYEAIIGATLTGIITSWNNAAENIYGYTAKEIIGQHVSVLVPPERTKELDRELQTIKMGGKIVQYETLQKRKNGETFNISLTISPIRNKLNKTIGASIIGRDITQSKLSERQFAIQYRVALALAESTNLNNAAHSILKTICEILEWQVGEIWAQDQSINALRYVSAWFAKDSYQELEESSHNIKFSMGEGVPGYIWKIKKPYWIADLNEDTQCTRKAFFLKKNLRSCFGFPIIFQEDVMGVMLFFGDHLRQPDINFFALFTSIGSQIGTFVKRKRTEGDLLYLAQHDVLTGLANRTVLENNLNAGIGSAKRNNTRMAVLYLDLDNFKKINDSMGHAKGDLMLQQVGSRISKCVRELDTVARFGGDEFTVLLPNVTRAKDMATIAQKILDAISKPFLIENVEYYITASMGISIYPDDGHDAQTLLQKADMAMYHAKVHGKDNYQFCLPSMAASAQEKLILETKLHQAIEQHEFVLYYQPKINIKTGKISGLEALIRWECGGDRIIAPNKFIPLAEETNMIAPIGEWVLRTACAQMKKWQDQGLKQPITIAINVSAHQFNTGLLTLLENILQETGLAPQFCELELTETAVMEITESNFSLLRSFQDLGIQLSIDDFGTGYSSFAYLKNFKLNTVKIDQSFISDIPDDINTKEIVLAIIAMAHALNVKVIAEGVEKKEQLDFLREANCDEYQGFLYSKPVIAEEIYKMLTNESDRKP